MAFATNSLPVPVSPSSKAVESNGATFCTNSSTRCNAGLLPTICWQLVSFSNRRDISVEAPRRISRRGCSTETLAPNRNSLCKGASLIFSTVAKAVLIVVWSFPGVAQDCAASFTPGQPLKCDGLDKYGRLWDLFGVTAEVLSGAVSASGQMSLIVGRPNLNSLPSGTPRVHGPVSWAQQRQGN